VRADHDTELRWTVRMMSVIETSEGHA